VALLSVIRRWHLRDGMAIREIARRTELSRNTIRKYLSTGIVELQYPLQQTHEMLLDAHNHVFRVVGGVPKHGIYDNMKTAVDRIRKGRMRDINTRFKAMVSHFLLEAEFCNPAFGWEKGQIEKNVQDSRHRIWQGAPSFENLDALNTWLEQRWAATRALDHRQR
jgi:transposase